MERYAEYGISTAPGLRDQISVRNTTVRAAGGKSDWFNVLTRMSTISIPFQHHVRSSHAYGP